MEVVKVDIDEVDEVDEVNKVDEVDEVDEVEDFMVKVKECCNADTTITTIF